MAQIEMSTFRGHLNPESFQVVWANWFCEEKKSVTIEALRDRFGERKHFESCFQMGAALGLLRFDYPPLDDIFLPGEGQLLPRKVVFCQFDILAAVEETAPACTAYFFFDS